MESLFASHQLNRISLSDKEREHRREQRRVKKESEGKKKQTKDLDKKWHRIILSDNEEDGEEGVWFFDRESK